MKDGRRTRRVVVIGQGYVGLPLALRAAESGFEVIGIETDRRKVKLLDTGDSYIDDVTPGQLHSALRSGRYRASAEYADAYGFDVCVITVPTPLRAGEPDLTCVIDAATAIAGHIRPGCTVILESTSYPGTTEEILRPVLEAGSGLTAGPDFHLGFSPERIDPGNAQWTLVNTPKIVSGLGEQALEQIVTFYGALVQTVVPVSGPRTAELAKLLENTFRAVNIALVNEIATVAADLGANIWEAIDAAASKPFGYLRFTPGPGVGGHCLPIDPLYLSWQVRQTTGRPLRIVEAADEVNRAMPEYVVDRLATGLAHQQRSLDGSRVLLLGLAYKANSSDLRESPPMQIAGLLAQRGARVRVAEPVAPPEQIPAELVLAHADAAELAAADAVVVLTDHDCFDYQLVTEQAAYVFDTRNRCRGPNVERL
jgi:UDP-N-acetyl-D-glucosamine dehydrogenase